MLRSDVRRRSAARDRDAYLRSLKFKKNRSSASSRSQLAVSRPGPVFLSGTGETSLRLPSLLPVRRAGRSLMASQHAGLNGEADQNRLHWLARLPMTSRADRKTVV